ncbi:MAG: hypothetical protein DSZ05_01985 [Sulfurospirillum sp.]|nr:MAG: hypothetical protein DSZ05_01985 [Sulfurospirillum sp.]
MFPSYKTIFITLLTLLLLVVIGAFVRVSLKLNTVRAEEASDNLLIYFRHLIDREKANALFLSVALSDNKSLKDALIEGDEEAGYRILIETLDKLKTYTFIKDVRTQIITQDLDIFARSWENESFAGMPLEGFRADLQRIRRIQKPKVSIDPGRLLTIKATTPFKNGAELIGYIEAIKTFDEITLYLRKKGIELLVLMDNRYLDIATLMRDNPTLGDYVVSNRNYNSVVTSVLESYADRIAKNRYFMSDDYLHVVDEMRDSAGERIGYYLLTIPKMKMVHFENREEQISFFLRLSKDDLYDVVNSWEQGNGSYKNMYDKEFIRLLESVDEAQRAKFDEEARAILKGYTREELINIILQKRYVRQKEGKIR